MHYLVTGGAGYIGSHIVRALLDQGDTVSILDNFSTGHRWATQGQEVIEVDLTDLPSLQQKLSGKTFDGVFHFAAKSLVGESQREPLIYYRNNVAGSANLLECAKQNGWGHCVFSSTAAIYGNPVSDLITETHPKQPINVYGQTKKVMEEMLEALCNSSDFSAVCLRYFNAAGAAGDSSLGEWHEPETHLIPNALRAASGEGPPLTIFGDDYATPDGTCIRDYIHVEDLASAHVKAMRHAQQTPGFRAFNLGNGQGFSVREVFAACEQAVGRPITHSIGERRPGDPAVLVADATLAREVLDWQPQATSLSSIVDSAWRWEMARSEKR